MRPLCSASVDLDGIGCYYAIHGLGAAPAASGASVLARVCLDRALPRFCEMFARRGLRATFFFVARDVEADGSVVADLARAGHEIGNHSYSHAYDLARRPRQVIDAEVRRAHEVLAAAAGAGAAPVGFRAPGYGLAPALLDVLADRGYRYDSSLLPSPVYFGAKASALAWMGLRGRSSASVLHSPAELLAPADPYRPDVRRPWRRGQSPVVELPIAVTRGARLPAIGTAIVAGPRWLRARVLAGMRGRPFFNLELHGIDLVDADADGIPAELRARRPDLRVPLEEKRRRLEAALDRIALDFDFARLRDVAALVQKQGRL